MSKTQFDNFDHYLQSLAKQKVQVEVDPYFKLKILNLTVDQLKHEEFVLDELIQSHKDSFSQQEIINKEKYAKICSAHSEFLNPINGQLHHLQNNHKLLNLNYQNLKDSISNIQFTQIKQQNQAFKEQSHNLEKIFTFVSIPSILNQCLQSNHYVKAIQIIRHYENQLQHLLPQDSPDNIHNKILRSIDKEVILLKQKVKKAVYIQLETSFKYAYTSNQRHTKNYITMLKALKETKEEINQNLLRSRTRYLRQYTQNVTLEFYKSLSYQMKQSDSEGNLLLQHVLAPFLGQIKDIYKEFEELKIKNTTEWLVERQLEARNLVKVIIKKSNLQELIDTISITDKFNHGINQVTKVEIEDLVKQEINGRIKHEIQEVIKKTLKSYLDSQKQIQEKQLFKPDLFIELIRINLKLIQSQMKQIRSLKKVEIDSIIMEIVEILFNKSIPQIFLQHYELHFQNQNVVFNSIGLIAKLVKELSEQIQGEEGNHTNIRKMCEFFERKESEKKEQKSESEQNQAE